jgi:FkbH-like protein
MIQSRPWLRLSTIPRWCYAANWDDKVSNLRRIARELNIGLDSLVFVDDSAFERNLIRSQLSEVAVPELPDDPTLIPTVLADAGYFETLSITTEDRARTAFYQANRAREAFQAEATDLAAYLCGLRMELIWRRFDVPGVRRIVQLINKTNQFNLTARHYTEEDVLALMKDSRAFGLQMRLLDKFCDNGIIAVIIGRMINVDDLLIETWLMSCRVLGRDVEKATLSIIIDEAKRLGAKRLIGLYRATGKNGMVREHYSRLGFTQVDISADGGSNWIFNLENLIPVDTFITIRQG